MLAKRRKAMVSTFLAARSERRRLQGVASARRRACRDAVKEQCSWALLVKDWFHVINRATPALPHVRKRLTRHADEADQQRLKGRSALRGKAPEDWPPEKRLELDGVLVDFPAWRLAHSLEHWRRRWDALPDVPGARTRLRAWLYWGKQAGRKELNELAATIRRWRQGSENLFRDRVTNGVTAGINTKIKLLKRVAYGLPNFAHIRARLLLPFTLQ